MIINPYVFSSPNSTPTTNYITTFYNTGLTTSNQSVSIGATGSNRTLVCMIRQLGSAGQATPILYVNDVASTNILDISGHNTSGSLTSGIRYCAYTIPVSSGTTANFRISVGTGVLWVYSVFNWATPVLYDSDTTYAKNGIMALDVPANGVAFGYSYAHGSNGDGNFNVTWTGLTQDANIQYRPATIPINYNCAHSYFATAVSGQVITATEGNTSNSEDYVVFSIWNGS